MRGVFQVRAVGVVAHTMAQPRGRQPRMVTFPMLSALKNPCAEHCQPWYFMRLSRTVGLQTALRFRRRRPRHRQRIIVGINVTAQSDPPEWVARSKERRAILPGHGAPRYNDPGPEVHLTSATDKRKKKNRALKLRPDTMGLPPPPPCHGHSGIKPYCTGPHPGRTALSKTLDRFEPAGMCGPPSLSSARRRNLCAGCNRSSENLYGLR